VTHLDWLSEVIEYIFAHLLALSKLISTLKESENLSNDQEIDFLKALLESKELNALVNVHTKVAKVGRDDRLAPVLSTSAQVLYEVLEQLSQHCHLNDDCKEAFHLLQDSHLQVSKELKERKYIRTIYKKERTLIPKCTYTVFKDECS